MYCLQWLLPVLLMPIPRSALNMGLLHNYSMFMVLYLAGFFLERKPCTICSAMFFVALVLICYSCSGNCFFYCCGDSCE